MGGKGLLCKKHFGIGEESTTAILMTFTRDENLSRVRLAQLA